LYRYLWLAATHFACNSWYRYLCGFIISRIFYLRVLAERLQIESLADICSGSCKSRRRAVATRIHVTGTGICSLARQDAYNTQICGRAVANSCKSETSRAYPPPPQIKNRSNMTGNFKTKFLEYRYLSLDQFYDLKR
jgi:hypothetical protein